MTPLSKFTGKLIVVEGPTASGKTDIAIELASYFGAEIISADSRQFYKELPIGTAAPTSIQRNKVPHHFVAMLSVADDYNVSRFEHDVPDLLVNKFANAPLVIMVGGSGLYIDAVCNGIDILPDIEDSIRNDAKSNYETRGIKGLQEKLYQLDPVYYQEVDLNNPARLLRAIEVCLQTGEPYSKLRKNKPQTRSFDIIKIGIRVPREILVDRINNRVDEMIKNGWIEEAKSVYPFKDNNSLNTVGYKELFAYFEKRLTFDQAIEKIKTNTRRYAKRQMTWFRKDKEIQWFDHDKLNGMVDFVKTKL
jgi:tRNA dimethylallyltransferase